VADNYQEALRVWTKSKKKVLLIGPMRSGNYQYLDFEKITLGIQNVEDLEVLGKLGQKVRVHLEVETGMNRQGFAVSEFGMLIKALKKFQMIEVEGVFSHLADADSEDDDFTKKQEKLFSWWLDELGKRGIKPRWVHLAATAGVLKTTDARIDAVRLGMGLYRGGVRLVSKVVKVRRAAAGEKVGYNCAYETKKEGWLGVIPVGYFEALDRKLSNQGLVKYRCRYYPIVGRICMNMCVVNFGNVRPNLWDEVEVEGAEGENSFGENAKKCGTIDYEMMTRLNGTIRREMV
jgi:alanine racemase